MGAAKRRREAQQDRKITVRVRNAGGRPSEILESYNRTLIAQHNGSRTAATAVPCGGYTACCHQRVEITPLEDIAALREHLDIEFDGPRPHLRQREDGSCIHLGAAGWTIRDHRPLVCRAFDCRLLAIASGGRAYPMTDNITGPKWEFEIRDFEDARIRDVFMLEVARWQYKRGITADDVLMHLLANYKRTSALLEGLYRQIDRLPTASQQRIYRKTMLRRFRLAASRLLTPADFDIRHQQIEAKRR